MILSLKIIMLLPTCHRQYRETARAFGYIGLVKEYRLNRLFNARSKRCFDVAMDHGFFNVKDVLAGIEDLAKAVQVVVAASPDAIQLTIGQAHLLQSIPGRDKPALVLRTDVANVYARELPRTLFSRVIEDALAQAVQLDAACVVANLFRIPGEPEVADQCVRNILRLAPACERYHMPLMVEPLVFKPNSEAGGYMVDGDPDKIIPLVRQAVELGADIIKADPTDDPRVYHKVVQTAGRVPVLVRGGGKVSDREILERTWELVQQGVAGIVYGRNIIQNKNPAGMTRALMKVLHENVTPDTAAEELSRL
jgi:DhnA family fructose-bisphosphate aldolase class Ia